MWAVGRMTECCDKILCCGSSVRAGIVMKHQNTPTEQAMSLVLDRTTQFPKCVATDNCINCGALREEFQNQNAFSVPKHCAHNLAS
jgi:hypothetical protein